MSWKSLRDERLFATEAFRREVLSCQPKPGHGKCEDADGVALAEAIRNSSSPLGGWGMSIVAATESLLYTLAINAVPA